ncbi:phage tail fiber protein [Erwinia persicina]|uniref:phage tail fiber protein n=1 Tax=Erwinia persicina TaxID=55211 RepID=UPI001785DA76|nr:hypothetical protein [Erwinia persicina]MBD8168625.1 hypothetical protein [Erwinia persicina]
MPAGTIVLTINSKTVTGSGTAFTTELKVNDFVVAVVGGVTYTLGVAAIASNTSLTLNTAFGGPTTSGLAWTAVPNQVLVGITAQVASDTARAIRGLNYDKDNWQKIYSDVASVTVQRPDGSTFTGPSWGYMSAQYANKADKTALDAYAKKGENSDITKLNGLTIPLESSGLYRDNEVAVHQRSGTFSYSGAPNAQAAIGLAQNGCGFQSIYTNYRRAQLYMNTSGAVWARFSTTTSAIDTTTPWSTMWSTANTTIDTNNFIKRASPIARLTNDVSQMQPDFAVDEQHIVAGLVSVNAEAEGVSAEKSAVGVYRVKGAIGLADEGWTLEVPQDINGNRLCFVGLSTDKEGVITVSVFKRRFDVDSAMIVAGEPMDIPEGRWIDLRLQMPEDSAWNTHMREMEQAAEGEEQTS